MGARAHVNSSGLISYLEEIAGGHTVLHLTRLIGSWQHYIYATTHAPTELLVLILRSYQTSAHSTPEAETRDQLPF